MTLKWKVWEHPFSFQRNKLLTETLVFCPRVQRERLLDVPKSLALLHRSATHFADVLSCGGTKCTGKEGLMRSRYMLGRAWKGPP